MTTTRARRRPSSARSRGVPLVLQLRAAGLPVPETEVRFARPRRWAFDFAWGPPWRIALEIEGGVWTTGRHTRGRGYTNDVVKYNQAAILGWLVIRATTAMVRSGAVVDDLRAAFHRRGLE